MCFHDGMWSGEGGPAASSQRHPAVEDYCEDFIFGVVIGEVKLQSQPLL
jgi:hypothetical protein